MTYGYTKLPSLLARVHHSGLIPLLLSYIFLRFAAMQQ